MGNQSLQVFLTLSSGFSVLGMAVEVAGLFLCLAFRHLSGWTILVASGFAGLLVSGGIRWLYPAIGRDLMGPLLMVGGLISLLSLIAVVGGLWMTFLHVQRRLAMALEPKDGWR